TAHHQGYIAETVDFKYSTVEDILKIAQDKKEKPFIVVLDGIEDPHNLGAIIRTCECAGVHGIIIPKDRACNVNETVIRTSTGAIAEMAIAKVVNLKQAIEQLKKADVWVFAAEINGNDIYRQNLNLPIAIVI
ncbi:MAG: RNA methyltransferase, partial [Candidatus Gastranaerophilales bacterium]|nr:RNA methyltransferase [Candidatus Gastranaerophilales bacterium]